MYVGRFRNWPSVGDFWWSLSVARGTAGAVTERSPEVADGMRSDQSQARREGCLGARFQDLLPEFSQRAMETTQGPDPLSGSGP